MRQPELLAHVAISDDAAKILIGMRHVMRGQRTELSGVGAAQNDGLVQGDHVVKIGATAGIAIGPEFGSLEFSEFNLLRGVTFSD